MTRRGQSKRQKPRLTHTSFERQGVLLAMVDPSLKGEEELQWPKQRNEKGK